MQPPTTPPPNAGDKARITDYFPPIKQSGQSVRSKRDMDETSTEDRQPAKRRKVDQDHSTTNSFRTGRLHVDVDTPKNKKTPSSARLLDDTDLGLRDRVVGRRDFMEEEAVEDVVKGREENYPKISRPIRAPVSVNNPRRRNPASSRLLDDVDGGLADSLVGRFETPRYQGAVSRGGEEKRNDGSSHDTVDDDSEAETIKAYDSEDDMSSVENRDDDDIEEDSDKGEDSEDENKENVPPRVRYRTPSPQRLPPIPEQHKDQNDEALDSSPGGQASAGGSPSSFLLPSPVVDLPAPQSSPSPSSPSPSSPSPSSPSPSSSLSDSSPAAFPSPPSTP